MPPACRADRLVVAIGIVLVTGCVRSRSPSVQGCPDQAEGLVTVLGPGHCVVPRNVLLGTDPGCVSHSPAPVETRSISGYQFGGIRPSSVYALCGLQNGDVWRSLNGRPVTTPEEALAAYPLFREARSLEIGVLRAGRPLMVRIDVSR
jgi:hypothetical protein